MNEHKKIGVLGGDARTQFLVRTLADAGYECALWGQDKGAAPPFSVRVRDIFDAVKGSAAVVFPLPVSRDSLTLNAPAHEGDAVKLQSVFDLLDGSCLAVGGGAPPAVKDELDRRGIKYIDYAESEEFAAKNALPTVEGALAIAITETPRTIAASRCAVVGYGRIGRRLSRALEKLGAKVSVVARRGEALAAAGAEGHTPVHISKLGALAGGYDIIFNTAPARIFSAGFLSKLDKKTLVVDLASAPYGADRAEAEAAGVRYIVAPGLPGRFSPESAGEIMGECVRSIFASEGIEP